ncbi:hypothetical protein [Psychromonas aquatilis]|uniref:Uncharacterized protein n=1 Tax=Psychromonas aquatilis TaxID=2005072 RepID=A0ABU9GQU5_9GAMM
MKKGQKMKLTKVAAALSAVLLFGCDDITPNSTDSGSGSGTDSGIDSGTGSGTGSGSGTDSGSGTNLAAQILDTLIDDGGELRVKLADAAQVSEIVSGQVSATLQLQLDSDTTITSEETKNTGYVSIYSEGTSNSNLHGDIIFASNGVIKQRDENGDQIEVEGATYTEGDAIDFVAKWDETTYSFSLDGGETFFGPYASKDKTPVTVISFKLGDTSGQSNHEFNVDDVVIEDAGASVFSDNFDSYTEGESLDPELNADAIYNKSSSEATVQIVSFGTGSTDGGEDGSEGGDDGSAGGSGDGSEGGDGEFPEAVDEFNFTNGAYTNSGSASTPLKGSNNDTFVISQAMGATGDENTALKFDQDVAEVEEVDVNIEESNKPYAHLEYTSEAGSGADQLTGSFTLETVLNLSSRTIANDVALIDFADTKEYLGFKTYIEKDDSTVKFKIYGAIDTETGEGLSTEVATSNPLTTESWNHIAAVYNTNHTN